MKWLEQIQRYDERWYLWFSNALPHQMKVVLARTVSLSGDGWMYAVICAVLYLQGHAQAAIIFSTLLIAFSIEVPSYLILKNTLRRQRPHQRLNICPIITASDKFSFPSGHTAGAFLFATVIAWYSPDAVWMVFSWALAIGLSRVALGVHYLTDIVAGALLGVGIASVALVIAGGF